MDIDLLIETLKEDDSTKRRAAVRALGEIEDPRVIEPLIAALEDENGIVRQAAVEELGKIRDPRAIKPLIASLGDKYSWVRRAAVEALGEIGDTRAVKPLIVALGDEKASMRKAAEKALVRIGNTAIDPLIAALGDLNADVRTSAGEVLVRIGSPAIDALIAALEGDDAGVQWGVALILGEIREPSAIDPLIAALQEEDDDLRRVAAWALGRIGDRCAFEPLIAALRAEDAGVRQAATWALGRLGEPRAVDPLSEALDDKDASVQREATWALIAVSQDSGADLGRAVRRANESTGMRWAHAWDLGQIGNSETIEPLIAALRDKNAGVRTVSAWALVQIGLQDPVYPQIITALKEDADLRSEVELARQRIFIPEESMPGLPPLGSTGIRVQMFREISEVFKSYVTGSRLKFSLSKRDDTLSPRPPEKKRQIDRPGVFQCLRNAFSSEPEIVMQLLSIAYPRRLSKGDDPPFLVTFFPEKTREIIKEHIVSLFEDEKYLEEVVETVLHSGMDVTIEPTSHDIDFKPERYSAKLQDESNYFQFTCKPKPDSKPGKHRVTVVVVDQATDQLILSAMVSVQVVDYITDSISRPLVSKVGCVILGINSLLMSLLGLLGQIDITVGLTSGTAFMALAALLYSRFLALYRRTQPAPIL